MWGWWVGEWGWEGWWVGVEEVSSGRVVRSVEEVRGEHLRRGS